MSAGRAALAAGALVALALLNAAAWGSPALLDALRWTPAAAGQPWRYLSAHLVHLTPLHWAGNMAGLAVVAVFLRAVFGPHLPSWRWALGGALALGVSLHATSLGSYAGLSAWLHGAVAFAAIGLLAGAAGRRRLVGAAVLAGLLVKCLLERPWVAVADDAFYDMPVAVVAHALGCALGIAGGLVYRLRRGAGTPAATDAGG